MRDSVSHHRFRAAMTREGTIIVPAALRARFRSARTVIVEIAPERPGRNTAGIDEGEVAAIAEIQMEPTEGVRRCLLAQGALAPRRSSRGGKAPRRRAEA
jgi:bifunctional DNA-binding transcriptional regulator/antitoxin component of YhaV-PrlF toxin-antitoxin module